MNRIFWLFYFWWSKRATPAQLDCLRNDAKKLMYFKLYGGEGRLPGGSINE